MLSKDNLVWLYLIAIVILLVVVLLVGRDYFIPAVIENDPNFEIETGIITNDPPSMTLDLNSKYLADVNTNFGNFRIELSPIAAPKNVNNFVSLAQKDYYKGTYFHRLVPGLFMQGGDRNTTNDDPSDDGLGSPGYIIEDELNWTIYNFTEQEQSKLKTAGYKSNDALPALKLEQYTVAMANSVPNTNGSQFFIILAENDDSRLREMQGKYTVVGKVVSGFDVLDQMATTEIEVVDKLIPRPIRKLQINEVKITKMAPNN